MQPLEAAIVRLTADHAPDYRLLRRQCLEETPHFWHSNVRPDYERTLESATAMLAKHSTSETVGMFGLVADGAFGGITFTYRQPKKDNWLFGGSYVAPQFRGPLDAFGGGRAIDRFYDARIQFVAAREPDALLVTGIRRPNEPSIKAAKRNGFKCVTAIKNRPTMAGTSNDLLYFHRKLGG